MKLEANLEFQHLHLLVPTFFFVVTFVTDLFLAPAGLPPPPTVTQQPDASHLLDSASQALKSLQEEKRRIEEEVAMAKRQVNHPPGLCSQVVRLNNKNCN